MRHTILKYLGEMSLVLKWKTGNSHLSNSEGTLEQEIWTPLLMSPCYTDNDFR